MSSLVWNLFSFAVALGILVTVHEAGHFIAAKRCGVKVLTFSIGFGPVLFKRKLKDGCDFALSLIPLGGYVRMKGESEDDNASDSYKKQSAAKRAFIIAAGPLCNILLAIFLYFLTNLIGVQVLKPVIGDVIPNSEAFNAGLVPQSLITEVNGNKVRSWSDVVMELSVSDETLNLKTETFNGGGKALLVNLKTPPLDERESAGLILQNIGLRPMNGKTSQELTMIKSGSPADLAGIKVGDRIVAVNGVDTPNWYRTYDAIRQSDGSTIKLLIEREGQIYETEVRPDLVYVKSLKRSVAQIGVGTSLFPEPALNDEVSFGVGESLQRALTETKRMSYVVINAVIKMLSGAVSAENISGPIAMAKGAGDSASAGIAFFLSFLAAISVNLGILNLLPIPVLDGGQLVFIAYETVFRKAPGQKAQRMLTALGLSILLGLMLLAIFNDIRGL